MTKPSSARNTCVARGLRICLLLPTVLLVACGSASREPAASSTSTSSGPRALVIYSKSGGIAGIRERLSVDPSGRATLSQGLPANAKTVTVKLPPAEVDGLRRARDDAGLASLPSGPSQGCADCFLYEITYAGTVWKGDEATLPQAVRPAIQALDRVVAGAGIEQPLNGK